MAYTAVGLITYIYSLFSPYKIADYISNSLPAGLGYVQMGAVFILAVALLVGRRKMLNLLLLGFGAFEGYVGAVGLIAGLHISAESALIVTICIMAAGAYLVYALSKFAITAFLALTAGYVFIAAGGHITLAPVVTVIAFAAIYLFYRYVSTVVAALLGSILLLLFLIQLNIPGFTPYILSATAFSLSILIRYAFSRIVAVRAGSSGRPALHRARN